MSSANDLKFRLKRKCRVGSTGTDEGLKQLQSEHEHSLAGPDMASSRQCRFANADLFASSTQHTCYVAAMQDPVKS